MSINIKKWLINFKSLLAVIIFMVISAAPSYALDLIMFHSETCYICEKWEKEVGIKYNLTSEAKIAPLKRVDAFDIPSNYQLKADINFTPTFVLVEDDKEISRIVGYIQEDYFWFFLDEELKKIQ